MPYPRPVGLRSEAGVWFMQVRHDDDGGVVGGLLLIVLLGVISVAAFVGYVWWEDHEDTTPPPAAVPGGSEQLSGNGASLVIPRGWDETRVSDRALERSIALLVAADPDAADASGLDQVQVDPEAVAFSAVEGDGGKNDETLNVVTAAHGDTDLLSTRSVRNVQLERLGAKKIAWTDATLAGVAAAQVDYQLQYGTVTLHQRQYYLKGDNDLAVLTFTALKPIGDKVADSIADTLRVD